MGSDDYPPGVDLRSPAQIREQDDPLKKFREIKNEILNRLNASGGDLCRGYPDNCPKCSMHTMCKSEIIGIFQELES